MNKKQEARYHKWYALYLSGMSCIAIAKRYRTSVVTVRAGMAKVDNGMPREKRDQLHRAAQRAAYMKKQLFDRHALPH